ncbi:hypothetical protein [Achromobacter denitrificans]|uniref:hypothetical protein n=1 Tax=Achromobacter denitrificans TaxID=32002 RepID=UPI002432E281|nr:hypothetical protein [Achromobacter denitrificans]MBV2160529.1 hypothetical protein [Achromobacter denitrificans]
MALNWRPHTLPPRVLRPTSVLVACIDPDDQDGIGPWLCGLYTAHPGGCLVAEFDGATLSRPYWWCFEDEVLEGLPC